MDEQEYHDLLIRIDTRQASMDKKLQSMEILMNQRMCHTHAEKIRTLERITWATMLAAIAAIVKSFWTVLGNGQ